MSVLRLYQRASLYRAATLAANIESWGTNIFVEEHAARVPYAIRCIKSGINDLQARRLRDMLVAHAPENVLSGRGSVVQTPNCWLMRRPNSIRRCWSCRTDQHMRSTKNNPPRGAYKTSPTTPKGKGAELP